MINIDTTLAPVPQKAVLVANKNKRRKLMYYHKRYATDAVYMRYISMKSSKRYNERQRWLKKQGL